MLKIVHTESLALMIMCSELLAYCHRFEGQMLFAPFLCAFAETTGIGPFNGPCDCESSLGDCEMLKYFPIDLTDFRWQLLYT